VRGPLVPRRRGARLAALLAALALGVAGLGACGGDDSDSDAGSAQDASSGPESRERGQLPEGAEDFIACLRDNGVDITADDLTGGGSPPIDQQDPQVRDAIFACQSQLPAGAGGGGP
jgi:hypothetical protein